MDSISAVWAIAISCNLRADGLLPAPPAAYFSSYAAASLARFEAQVKGRGVADFAAFGADRPQPFEQLALDARRESGRELDRPRGPSQHDSALGPAEVVEEPAAAHQRRLSRAFHLEQARELLAARLVGDAKAAEERVGRAGISVDREPDRGLERADRIFDQRRR